MSTPPWSLLQRDAAVQRGPHKSAHEYVSFLRQELADMVDRATWIVLPYHTIRHHPNLRISPMGVVPQHERRPRPIVDYSFSGVNADTITLAPPEAMQFGRTLERLIHQVVRSDPRFGPVHFLKIDIADGFYRVWLDIHDIPTLAVSIPSLPGEPDLLALPLALPMGWTQSPPAFCTVTETIADAANRRLHRTMAYPPPHRLEKLANSLPAPEAVPRHLAPPGTSTCSPLPRLNPLLQFRTRPLAAVDVFMDDFVAVAQGSSTRLTKVRRHLLHAIDSVFRPLAASDSAFRTEPISTSKLLKGDGAWAPRKTILGWVLDSEAMTLTLPPRRLQRLLDLLESIPPTQRRLSLATWHQLLGELRSMALALPGARGLFSHLQHALTTRHGSRLRLTTAFHRALADFRWIHRHLAERPTRLYELVPTAPTLLGTHDASGSGAGGVWLPQPTAIPRRQPLVRLSHPSSTDLVSVQPTAPVPVVWRTRFPPDVSTQLVSFDNPTGTLNNSELELVGAYLHDDVAVQCFDVRERTLRSATDNTAALYWYRKGSVTTTSPTASVLRQHAMHQRFHRYVALKDYIPGPLNTLADDASRPSLAPLPRTSTDAFLRDLHLAQTDVTLGVVSSRTAAAAAQWQLWDEFCASMAVSPSLQDVPDPIPYLQVFAYRYRNGVLNPSKRLVRSRTVEGALRSVGQTLASVGAADPRLSPQGAIDFRLKRMLAAYAKIDTPPNRVKPLPVPILRHVLAQAVLADSDYTLACADMICLAFFFLLRPGEYTGTATSTQPFQLRDVRFFLGGLPLATATTPAAHLLSATFVTLEFTTQKSGVRGEVIGLGRSGDQQFCPVLAAARRVLHLRDAGAPPLQPLASYRDPAPPHSLRRITPSQLTDLLRLSVHILGPTYGFLPQDVSARSLRAAGAMALLCANVDSDRIRLLGRWQSDQMFRYLHVQAEPVMRHFSSRMLSGGHYTLLPNAAALPPP